MEAINIHELFNSFDFNNTSSNSDFSEAETTEKHAPVFTLHCDFENRYYLSADISFENAVNFFTTDENQKSFLSSLESALHFSNLEFSWDSDASKSEISIYLDQYDELTKYLFRSGFEIYINKSEISPVRTENNKVERCQLILKVDSENNSVLAAKTESLYAEEKIKLLSPKYVLIGKKIYYCPEAGKYYNKMLSFTGKIAESEIQSLLCIFATAFPEINIEYKNLEMRENEAVHAEKGILFKSLDESGTLKLDFLDYIKELPVEFVSSVHPHYLISIHDDLNFVEKRRIFYETNDSKISVLRSLEKKLVVQGSSIYVPSDIAVKFLSNNLGFLTRNFRLFGTDELKKFKLKYSSPKTKLNISSGIDFFGTDCHIEIEDQVFSFEDALKLFEENNYIPLNDGTKAIVDSSFFSKLRRILGKKDKNGEYHLTFFDLPLVENLIDSKIEGEAFNSCRKVYEGLNSVNDSELNFTGINATLRDYQNYGAKWMTYLAQNKLGGCLADDMGLGKTLQTITLLNQLEGNALVVVPKSLISNWKNEILKFAPHFDAVTYYGTDRNLDEVKGHQILITTYAMVRNDIEKLSKLAFSTIILDEVQAIKNSQSQIAKAVMLLNGTHRFALSGTPMENNLLELYSIFRFLNPAMFGSVQDFNSRYAAPIQKDGNTEALSELGTRIKPFILRRLKNQVAKELPEKTEQIVYVEMTDEQKQLYEKQRKFYKDSIENTISQQGFSKSTFMILQGLTELRQLATVPESKTEGEIQGAKWDVLMENLREISGSGHKILVFSNFLTSIDEIAKRLSDEGIGFVTMTGATSNRAEIVKKFQNDSSCKVFLMTLKTGGVGLNLTQADYVFIIDPWWNTSAEQQAIDRTHRIGQTKNVFCYRFIAKDSIEEKILELQKKKKDLFDSIITSDGQMMKKLSEEDLNFILND